MDAVRGWWGWLGDELELTAGGWIAFTFVALVGGGTGLVAVVADAVLGGEHGDQEAGVLLIFVVIAVGLVLGLVFAIDAGFRALRKSVRRLGSPAR